MNALSGVERWVLSGSLCGWGDVAIPFFDLVVFLWVPPEIRITRLKRREIDKFGIEALSPEGKMYENHQAFIEWAMQYDDGGLDIRSKALHESWLRGIDCDIFRFEGELTMAEIMEDLKTDWTMKP